MLSFVSVHQTVSEALPTEPKEIRKLPRAYLANLIYTLVGKSFADWVSLQIKARNEKVAAQQNLMVAMDPEIAKIFQA